MIPFALADPYVSCRAMPTARIGMDLNQLLLFHERHQWRNFSLVGVAAFLSSRMRDSSMIFRHPRVNTMKMSPSRG